MTAFGATPVALCETSNWRLSGGELYQPFLKVLQIVLDARQLIPAARIVGNANQQCMSAVIQKLPDVVGNQFRRFFFYSGQSMPGNMGTRWPDCVHIRKPAAHGVLFRAVSALVAAAG
jgi:hypothetical protein